MPSCRAPGDLSDGCNNVGISRAAANVAAHPLANLGVGKFGVRMRQVFRHIARHAAVTFGQHSHSGADLAGSAVTTLKTIMFDEGRLKRMQIVVLCEPLDGG